VDSSFPPIIFNYKRIYEKVLLLSKGVDYYISEVRYSIGSKHVGLLKVHQDTGGLIGPSELLLRNELIPAIETGTTFVTIINTDENWFKESDVYIVEIDGLKFIRTDTQKIASDNINLPKF
jgi:hypothetical protein